MAVEVRGKGHALLGDLAQLCEAEHLKSAAVGEDGAVPAGKLVQTAHLCHQLVARTQMQMVGVAEHDLRTDVLQVMGRQAALDGAGGGNILECGGLHRAVYGLELAPPGVVLLLEQLVGRQRRHNIFSFLRTENSRASCRRGRMLSLRIQSRDITAAKRYNSYKISIASPKLKKRYFCSTATL